MPVYYYQVPINIDLFKDMSALGTLSDTTIRPSVDRCVDTISRAQYTVNAAVNILNEAFCGSSYLIKSQLGQLRTTAANIVNFPSYKLLTLIRSMCQKSKEIQQSMKNVDNQLGKIVTTAIDAGTNCIKDLAYSVSTTLIMKTGSVAAAAQRVTCHFWKISINL